MPFSTLHLDYPNLQPGEHQSRWLEYFVDDRPLSRLFSLRGKLGALGWLDPETEGRFVRQLLVEAPFAASTGRAPLYVCSQCADLGCGAITVKVVKTPDSFIWKELGTQTDLDAEPSELLAEGFEFHFERSNYLSVFRPRR